MKNKEIAQELDRWFARNKTNPSRYSDNELGKTIQKIVISTDNWKAARRGNSRRGYQGMRETLARRNGWEPEEEE